MNLFIFGLGYSATSFVNLVAQDIVKNGGFVAATTRSQEKAEVIIAKGLRAHIFDGTKAGDATMLEDLAQATHIVTSISPPVDENEGDPVLAHHLKDIQASNNLEWIGYYSTVGVYGDHDGAWVDEHAELKPVSARSIARVSAEKEWMVLGESMNVPVALIRLAGIYGPGRNGFVNFKTGRARRIIKPGQVFNRIHVEDIAAITESAARLKLGGVFNGADDEPAPPQDVVEYAANKMGVPVPPDIPFEEANLSPMGRSFYGETKRVGNSRLKDALKLTLKYPTYRDAFDALWASNTWDQTPDLKAIEQ